MTSDVSVDIVILTWNDGEDALEAALSAQHSSGLSPVVTVVDNGSNPPFRPPAGVQFVRSETNRGVAGGRNLGISRGQAPFVAILDSDARLESHSLRCLVEPLLQDASIGLTGPVFVGVPATETAGYHPSLLRKVARGLGVTRSYRGMPRRGRQWDVDFTIGACQVFRRELYEQIGGIEPQGLFGPEDVEFCRQVRCHGRRVVQVADCGVHHDARRAWRAAFSRRGLHHARSVGAYYGRSILNRPSRQTR